MSRQTSNYLKAACLAIFVVILVSALPLVSMSQPTVLVDQYHENLLSLDPEQQWKMVTLANELISNGYAVTGLEVPISNAALGSSDIFIISEPASLVPSQDCFTSSELTDLQEFVNNGGGLLIAADFGINPDGSPTTWAAACQQLANAFGFTLDNNCPTDSAHNIYEYPYWITFNESTLGAHPIMRGVSSLQSFRTTTLSGPTGSSVLFSTYPGTQPASRPAAIAASYGQGRVVIYGNNLYLADVVNGRNIITPSGNKTVSMTGITAADNRRFAYQTITYLAGAQNRPLLSLTSPRESQLLYSTVNITGTACDSDISYYKVEYASASAPTLFNTIATINESRIMATLATWDTALVPEGNYIIRITVHKNSGVEYSRSVNVAIKHLVEATSIAQCKSYADETLISLSNNIATTGHDDFADCFYIEDQHRTSGIKVIQDNYLINRGDAISIIGIMGTLAGERILTSVLGN